MIRIRTGASWRHDPRVGALRRAGAPARAAAARALVDALSLEVDGVDIAAGRAEAPLLPSLEALLRAVARVVGGALHATVPFPDGEIELVIRRRDAMALLTVVALTRPTRLLARDVEVEVEALAAAALEASAAFARDLGEILPDAASREVRRLREAERHLRRTEPVQPRRPATVSRPRPPRFGGRATPVRCTLDLFDEDSLLGSYEGGRPDIGSLLVPGRLALVSAEGRELHPIEGIPFLALRDLGDAADALLAAARRGDARADVRLPGPVRAAPFTLAVDVAAARLAFPSGDVACSAHDLARAFAEAAAEFGRVARARNPRQAENAYLTELEAAAAGRIAQAEELAGGEIASPPAPIHRSPGARAVPQRPLGPGRLRRLSFRRAWTIDAGAPAGEGLFTTGRLAVVAGAAATVSVERRTGVVRWRAAGCAFAAAVPGAVLVVRGMMLAALSPRTGRLLWSRRVPGEIPSGACALARGPHLLAERGAVTALDPGSGRTLWRFEPPGAQRVVAAAFGGIAAIGADTGFLYGVDAAGRTAWRLRAPGPVLRPPSAVAGMCLALAASDPGTALLAIEPGTGIRRFQAALDLVPSAQPLGWSRRIAVGGGIGGDPAVTALERTGAVAWTVAPALSGPATIAAAGALLVVRDRSGALVALRRDGQVSWSRAARPAHGPPGTAAPAVVRGTVLAPVGDGLAALDARTGEIVGAVPGAAPAALSVDEALGIAAMDADGLAGGWRLATHLSVL